MQIWPGTAIPARRDVRRGGHQLLSFLGARRTRRAVPVRRQRRGNASRPAGDDGALLARLSAGRRNRGSATGTASTGPGIPTRGNGAIRPSSCSIRTRRLSKACGTGTRPSSLSLRRTRELEERSRQRAVCRYEHRHQPVLRLGERSTAEHAVASNRRLRDAREGLHQDADRHSRGAARHVCRHGASGVGEVPAAARQSRRWSCCRSTSSCRTPRCRRRGCGTTGATTRSATSRRTTNTLVAQRGDQVQEFKHLVKTLHEAGIEVILDVVYNHTGEGNHLGPVAVVQGNRQPRLLPADAGQPALLHGLHRARATR